jgi:hypothetical protein
LSLAVPVSEESAFTDRSWLMRRGRRLLVSAGILALAFFFAIIVIASTYKLGPDANLAFVIVDYIVTLGIAVPGLTLYMLRVYTDRSMRKGNPKTFTRTAKLGLVSISWVILAIVVILLVM